MKNSSTSQFCREGTHLQYEGVKLKSVKNWLQKWGKFKATSNFDMIVINFTTLSNHSESLTLVITEMPEWSKMANKSSVKNWLQKSAKTDITPER